MPPLEGETMTSDNSIMRNDEFKPGADEFTDPVSRRHFLKIMGASMALAGLTGCTAIRKPVQTIRPYAKRPEHVLPGKATYYASSLSLGEHVTGVLAATHSGRPTKLEGNPLHSGSLGALSMQQQATILDVYDPDRLMAPQHEGGASTWSEFETAYQEWIPVLKKTNGKGLVIVAEQQASPTVFRLIQRIQKRFPQAMIATYEALAADNQREGLYQATRRHVTPVYTLNNANVIVSFESDFLGVDPQSVRYSREFASKRSPDSPMNRLYMIESGRSITGAKADHRFAIKTTTAGLFFYRLVWELIQTRLVVIPSVYQSSIKMAANQAERHIAGVSESVAAIVEDIRQNRNQSIIMVGEALPAPLHGLAHSVNQSLRSKAYSVRARNFSKIEMNQDTSRDQIQRVVERLNTGAVETLILVGGNPLYTVPQTVGFESAMKKAKQRVHITGLANETSEHSQWVLPLSHPLESWGDLMAAYDGAISVVQPLIRPMYNTKSAVECLAILAGVSVNGYRQVRQTWRTQWGNFEQTWRQWLHDGVKAGRLNRIVPAIVDGGLSRAIRAHVGQYKSNNFDAIELVLRPDYTLYDGRFSNNGWMQEAPDPVTKLTWDNALLIGMDLAESLGIANEAMVKVMVPNGPTLRVPAYRVPGMAENSVSLALGYGKKSGNRIESGIGFNAYTLRPLEGCCATVELTQTFDTYPLSNAQEQLSMEGRPLMQKATLATYNAHPDFAKHAEEVPHEKSSWEEYKYDSGNQWGMAIDLSKCTGCNACVIACQAENNIPIVGKDEVRNGRDMHWIRVDRYFDEVSKDDATDSGLVQQPVTCLHCENAPCEQVCPVAATVHDEEGINNMVYNRCIGTRYCANNCPVKVRRFNFFDYHQRHVHAVKKESTHVFDLFKEPAKQLQMQFNPDVTVRMRGVMEKCTYCLQRIKRVGIGAKNDGRSIQDGEVKTACQQSCPADAISFGNILDKTSRVYKDRHSNRNYELLRTLRLKSRTTYLAAIRNANPKLVPEIGTRDSHGQHNHGGDHHE
tara:strand:+ start:167 stop:3250 length:3084 start_codon:yes stop_codon:yes gene_type:complete